MKTRLANDSMVLTVVKIFTASLGIVVAKILSSQFSLHEYGTYSQALLITSVATSISICGCSDAVNYYWNKSVTSEEKEKYVSTIFSLQYLIGGVTGIIILLSQKALVNNFDNPELKSAFLFIAFMPLIGNLIAMLQILYISIGKSKIIAIRNAVISIITLIIILIAVYVTKDIITVLALRIFCDFLQFLYFRLQLSKYNIILKIKSTDIKLMKPILAYSIPMAGYIILNSFMRDLDKLFIAQFMNTEMLAIYTNASKILPFDMLTSSFAVVLLPVITKSVRQKNYLLSRNVFKNYLNLSLVTTLIMVLGAMISAKELMSFLYDPKYLAGYWVFIIYLIVDIIRFANISIILSASGKTKLLLKISIVSLAANVLLNYIFIQILGLIGPAVATLMVMLSTNIYIMCVSSDAFDLNPFKLFDIKNLFFLLSESIVLGSIIVRVKTILTNMNVSNTLILLVSYGSFVLIIGLLNLKSIIKYMRNINKINQE